MTHVSRAPKEPYFRVTLDAPRRGSASRTGLTQTVMEEMISIAPRIDGFLGLETHWSDKGKSVTISYWTTQAAVQSWRRAGQAQLRHLCKGLSLDDACRLNVRQVRAGWGRVLPFMKAKVQPPVVDFPDWTRRVGYGG